MSKLKRGCMGKNRGGELPMIVLKFLSVALKNTAMALYHLPMANTILCNKTLQLVA